MKFKISIQELEKRMQYKPDGSYIGLDMSGYGFGDNRSNSGNEECRIKNLNICKMLVPEHFKNLNIDDFLLQTWKGSVFWAKSYKNSVDPCDDLSSWSTIDIIFWIIKNKLK